MHILPQFGEYFLSDLKAVEIENWLLDLKNKKRELSNQTKNHVLYTFSTILNEAKRQELIGVNPERDIGALSRKPKKTDAFSLQELKLMFPKNMESLLEIWKDLKYACMVQVMALGGIRPGEARGLI